MTSFQYSPLVVVVTAPRPPSLTLAPATAAPVTESVTSPFSPQWDLARKWTSDSRVLLPELKINNTVNYK